MIAAYGGNNTAGPIDVATACTAHGGSGRMDFETETLVAAYRTSGNSGAYATGARTDALTTGSDPSAHLIAQPAGVRRLTPLEYERLQGYPDHWTAIPYRGRPAADGPRYRAVGNAFAVPVVAWIGKRLTRVDALLSSGRSLP